MNKGGPLAAKVHEWLDGAQREGPQGAVEKTCRRLAKAAHVPTVLGDVFNSVQYFELAGAAPGLVTGLIPLNIKVPECISGNQLPISVSVNGKPTPLTGTTLAVQ